MQARFPASLRYFRTKEETFLIMYFDCLYTCTLQLHKVDLRLHNAQNNARNELPRQNELGKETVAVLPFPEIPTP